MFFSIDFGIKKIGLSIGQRITKTISLLKPLKINNSKINWFKIKYLLKYWNPNLIIIGLPINNNKNRLFFFLILKFSIIFNKKYNIKILFHNEFLSTLEAKNFFLIYKKKFKINNIYIDSISSKLILKSWIIDNL
ncbi:MAG: Holliday junction resolvase RuvX [Enterobacteriaceae bacterium PSpicST2]|nr:MAG: Holliday junction resolvase RuvX [Enterobacteriaceae bacterium PSpicST2]WMC19123.1 MAG: Holliday junction resolvase RuvX [Enterobacteriaceae bacterium PSpicST1]